MLPRMMATDSMITTAPATATGSITSSGVKAACSPKEVRTNVACIAPAGPTRVRASPLVSRTCYMGRGGQMG